MKRRLPIGAELVPGRGVHFRVWAPDSEEAAVELVDDARRGGYAVPLTAEKGGYFSGAVAEARAGTRYKIKLTQGSFPDPASRFQPDGPHGPSQVIDPAFEWTDQKWRGRPAKELVMYEMHIGTFTAAGSWRAAGEQLPELARIGITMIEVMPVADFPGKFGWGYDGVDAFAPTRIYGTPDDARAFVNRAHELGLMVILDVVYNHVGPDGNFLTRFAKEYFSKRYECEWGDPLNFDGENSGPVREYFITNARYWIEEYHFDGLRLDATQQIFDSSATHVVAEIARAARAAAPDRRIFMVAENETQHSRFVRAPEAGGCGLDALWNDDFHHAAMVAATGRAEAYYSDFRGTAQEFVSAAKYGFLYQGQLSAWQQKRRGTPALDLAPEKFAVYLQNHDQVANSIHGLRLHQLTSPGKFRALTALLLLSPQIPMLFQGQEFAASAPFLYFADHNPELAQKVGAGRREFMSQFSTAMSEECRGLLAVPHAPETFSRCKLDFGERERNQPVYQLHQDVLRLRREDGVIAQAAAVDGAVLGRDAFVLRYFSSAADDRLLVVNLGGDLRFNPAPEPLLAPMHGRGWRVAWSSEAPAYGGCGTPPLETNANWMVPGNSAMLLRPHEDDTLPSVRLGEND